jgi:uncharacterized protein YkwD
MRSLMVIAALVLAGCQSGPPPTTGAAVAVPAGDVVGLVNTARAEQGLEPVRTNPRFAQAARDHAADMLGGGILFAHRSKRIILQRPSARRTAPVPRQRTSQAVSDQRPR